MNADPNARDKLLNDLNSTLTPASEPIAEASPAPPNIPDHELVRRIGAAATAKSGWPATPSAPGAP